MQTIDESTTVYNTLQSLTNSGLIIERIGEDAYNVISKATGAVLERLITFHALRQYELCMQYVAKQHGKDIGERFSYTKPVHSI